jgi:hypothetical protein
MYQAYAGRVRNGQPVIFDEVTLPENADIIITVLDESPSIKVSVINKDTLLDDRQAQRAAFEEFFTGIASITDEPITDDDLADLARNRVNIGRKLDL